MQSSAPDDGRKHRPKHVGSTWNNKLIYIVRLVFVIFIVEYSPIICLHICEMMLTRISLNLLV